MQENGNKGQEKEGKIITCLIYKQTFPNFFKSSSLHTKLLQRVFFEPLQPDFQWGLAEKFHCPYWQKKNMKMSLFHLVC